VEDISALSFILHNYVLGLQVLGAARARARAAVRQLLAGAPGLRWRRGVGCATSTTTARPRQPATCSLQGQRPGAPVALAHHGVVAPVALACTTPRASAAALPPRAGHRGRAPPLRSRTGCCGHARFDAGDGDLTIVCYASLTVGLCTCRP
jgi:hypothetical protein